VGARRWRPAFGPPTAAVVALVALALAGLALAGLAGCGPGVRSGAAGGAPPGARRGLTVGVAYDAGGPVPGSVSGLVQAGLAEFRAASPGVVAYLREFTGVPGEPAEDRFDRLVILCRSGADPVIAVGQGYAGADPATGPLARAARDCPHTRFGIVDDSGVSAPNVANLVFAGAQGAYLAGVAAALTSHTGQVGFLGGCHTTLAEALEAGYRAGAQAGRPGTGVSTRYLGGGPEGCAGPADAVRAAAGAAAGAVGPPDAAVGGRASVGKPRYADTAADAAARDAADALYAGGADVVLADVGTAGDGVFEAAAGRGGSAIGTDADQYLVAAPAFRSVILTSVVKQAGTAVEDLLAGIAGGTFRSGVTRFGLAGGEVGYATSGGRLAGLAPTLDGYRRQIVDGVITVPGSP
jgi:basic membrane protein A and related proteins